MAGVVMNLLLMGRRTGGGMREALPPLVTGRERGWSRNVDDRSQGKAC